MTIATPTAPGALPPIDGGSIRDRIEAIELAMVNLQANRQPQAFALGDLTNTQPLTKPTDGALARWNATLGLWVPGGPELSRLDYLNPSNYSLASANFVNPVQIDGTHLAMPAFPVPASGKIVWTFECILSAPAAGVNIYIMPFDTTLGHLGTFSIFSQQATPALVVHREWIITGLAPATVIGALQPTYTVDSGTATIYGNGGSIGAIVQTVRAA